MRASEPAAAVYRFGQFELNRQTRQLSKNGVRLRLQQQPLNLLYLLIEHAGEVVTREQIRASLWPPDTHVDYDNAINSSIRKLRTVLCDDPSWPRFIETQAGSGYRFISRIDFDGVAEHESVPPAGNRVPPRILLASGVLLIAVVSVVFWWSRRDVSLSPLTPVPLTENRGWEAEPSFSPEGTQIAYSWNDGARLDRDRAHDVAHIYVKLIGEGQPVRVTSGTNLDTSPAWSPDGRLIAFLRTTGTRAQIYVIPALGGAEHTIGEGLFTPVEPSAAALSWSPDGRFLAVAERPPPPSHSHILLVNTASGERKTLIVAEDEKATLANPGFSPNGRTLLFIRRANRCAIYVQKLGPAYRPVGAPRQVGHDSYSIPGATWMRDGKDIIYARYESGYRGALDRIRADSGAVLGELRYTQNAPTNPVSIAVASTGNRLAYSEEVFDPQVWLVRPGEPPRRFVQSSGTDETPNYSPDGKHVVFGSNRSGNPDQIWVCDRDGGSPVQLTHFQQGDAGTPRWSPDGNSIAFDHFVPEGVRIYVMSSDGTHIRRLTSENVSEAIPSWSSDGKWVYYVSDHTGRSEIWKAPIEGGKSIQVTRNGGYTAFECASRHSLLYTKRERPGLWELSLAGAEEKLVLPHGGGSREFSVVPDGIYYLTPPNSEGLRSVRFHSFTSRTEREVASLNIEVAEEGLTISPDRDMLLFTAAIRNESNIMIASGFP
jgi:Tol biopolymer transport system component/DNA-binding winged helix-turn-helix (wHTH) protein